MRNSKQLGVALAFFAVAVFYSAPSSAAGASRFGIGVQPVGVGINPDQYVFGFQALAGRIKVLQFVPSVDFGFGDNVKVTTVNLDLFFDIFSPPKTQGVFFVGAGQGIHMIKPEGGNSDTQYGLNFIAGVKLPFGERNYYDMQGRFGVGDGPDFRLLFGVMFGFGKTG